MSATQIETGSAAFADTMIKRVLQVASILAAVKTADVLHETVENRIKNQPTDELQYREDERTTNTA